MCSFHKETYEMRGCPFFTDLWHYLTQYSRFLSLFPALFTLAVHSEIQYTITDSMHSAL